jgi:hypothetical protein
MQEPLQSRALPDWAIDHARAWLAVGHGVPEVESRLVARGLDPATATAVLNRVLESHLKEVQTPSGNAGARESVHRILAALTGSVCLALAYGSGGGASAALTGVWLLAPVFCVCFPELAARSANPARAAEFRFVGWGLVIVILGYRLFLYFLITG